MTQAELLKFILSKGYRSHDEVIGHFDSIDIEVVEARLMGLVEKKEIGKAAYKYEGGFGYIYWVLK